MVQADTHQIANKQGYQAKTQESKAPSSMPAHRTEYEHPGGHANVFHEPLSTQAKGKQAPSSLSHQSGFNNDVHEPSSTKAQGNPAPSSTSAHSNGYGNGAPSSKSVHSTKYDSGYQRQSGHKDVYEPCSTQAQGKQDPSSMSAHTTGYGNGYERSGFVLDPPSTQAQGRQGPSSMLDQSTGYGKPPSTLAHGKLGKGNVYDSNSAFHGSSRTEGKGNQSGVHKPPSSDVIGNQSFVFSSDSRLVDDRFVSFNPPAYKPPPTETNQSQISFPCHGKFHDQAPVGGSEKPVHKQSLIDATRKPPDVPKSVPCDALPLGPETGHGRINGHRDHNLHDGSENSSDVPTMETTPVQPASIQVNVNVFCDKDGNYRLSPGPIQPQLQPQPRHQPPQNQLQPRPQTQSQPQTLARPQTQSQPRPQPQSQPRPQPQSQPKSSNKGCCSIL